MNYLKIYTLLLCAVLIAACSDDDLPVGRVADFCRLFGR